MRKLVRFMKKYSLVFLFLLLWEGASRFKIINPVLIPPFSKIILMMIKMIRSGELLPNLVTSITRAIAGLSIAILIGLLIGFVLGCWLKNVRELFQTLLELCSQINPLLVYHVLAIFLGITEFTRITIVVWSCLWPIIFNTILGITTINPQILKMGKSFGLSKLRLFYKIILPATMPAVFTGIRISGGYSLLILIAAEIMGARKGLGAAMAGYEHNFQISKMYVVVLCLCIVAVVLDSVLERIERLFVQIDESSLNSEL